MKYIDLLVIVFFLCIFYSGFSEWLKIFNRLDTENKYYMELKESNYFIFESFKNTCEGRGFESLYQWQKACKAMWNLRYIGWSNGREVLLVNETVKGDIFYGAWKGINYINDVYWME